MDFILVLASAIGFALIVFGLWSYLRKDDKKEVTQTPYVDGLNYLIGGDRLRALRKLKEAVMQDTSNTDAYIKLGDTLRELCELDKALKVHLGLTIRANLKPYETIEVYKSVVLDYERLENYEKSGEYLEKILKLDRQNSWALKQRVRLFQKSGEWNKAYSALKAIVKESENGLPERGKLDTVLATYKALEGRRGLENKEYEAAKAHFDRALELDPQCIPAHLYLGDYYREIGEKDQALEIWGQFAENNPDKSFYTFSRLESVLYELRSFGAIEELYKMIADQDESNLRAKFALATIYEKKGDLAEAAAIVNDVLDKNPDSLAARQHLIKIYHRQGEQGKAIDLALEIARLKGPQKTEQYDCQKCAHTAREPFWICPKCGWLEK